MENFDDLIGAISVVVLRTGLKPQTAISMVVRNITYLACITELNTRLGIGGHWKCGSTSFSCM